MMLRVVPGVLGVHGVFLAVRMRHVPAFVVMAMLVGAVLAVRMLVAMMAFAVVHVIGGRSVDLNWGVRAGWFLGHLKLLFRHFAPNGSEGQQPA